MVILVHTSQSVALSDYWLQILAAYGQMGVQLFFVASAYTLCLSSKRRKNEKNAIANFYIRRFFRVAPIYYLGIIGYFTLRFLLGCSQFGQCSIPSQYTTLNVIANILFVNGIYAPANNNIVPGGWSIGTEVLFYLVFPFLFTIISKFLTNKFFVVSLPLFMVMISCSMLVLSGHDVRNNEFIYFSLFNQLSVFAVGISLFLIHTYHGSLISRFKLTHLYVLMIGFSSISIYIGWIAPQANSFIVVPFISAIAFAFLIEIFKRNKSNKLWFLESIGQRSYSMYIIHFVFAHELSKAVNNNMLMDKFDSAIALLICYLGTVVATYYLAGFSAKYIEKYFIDKGKLMIARISSG